MFIGTLIVVSIITVRISDMILDSRIGALDRNLGFLFGLARGLLIIVVAFLFFGMAGSRKAAAGLGQVSEIPRGPAGHRGLADVALAG